MEVATVAALGRRAAPRRRAARAEGPLWASGRVRWPPQGILGGRVGREGEGRQDEEGNGRVLERYWRAPSGPWREARWFTWLALRRIIRRPGGRWDQRVPARLYGSPNADRLRVTGKAIEWPRAVQFIVRRPMSRQGVRSER